MNLFDVTHGMDCLAERSRPANDAEVNAYCLSLVERSGLPRLGGKIEPEYTTEGRGAKMRHWCVGATVGSYTQEGYGRRTYEPGSYSVLCPGYACNRDKVTLDELNEAGEVVSSLTMPLEPKKGGIVWTREQVREIAGKVAKKSAKRAPTDAAKRKRAIKLALRLRAKLRHAERVRQVRLRAILEAECKAREAEGRALAAEAENRKLWQEIEALTRPLAA